METIVNEDTGEILSTLTLQQRIDIATTLEYEYLTAKHGKHNHSLHESAAKTYEELEKAAEDIKGLKKLMKDAWSAVRETNDDEFIAFADLIRKNAMKAAAQCIRLAAAAMKASDSLAE